MVCWLLICTKFACSTYVAKNNNRLDAIFGKRMGGKLGENSLIKITVQGLLSKVEIFLEPREVAFLSPSKICQNSNFSNEIQIFANFAG